MKRVGYLAGAVGLAPAAMGFLAPTVAQGATAATAPSDQGKAVSLQHSGMLQAKRACAGNTAFTIPQDVHVKGHGWYAPNGIVDSFTCIGTVVVSLYYAKTFCKTASVVVSIPPGVSKWTDRLCGTAGHWAHHSFGIHENFSSYYFNITVCADSTYGALTCHTL